MNPPATPVQQASLPALPGTADLNRQSPTDLALLDRKRELMGIPEDIRALAGKRSLDDFAILAKHDIEAAKELLNKAGYYIAMTVSGCADQDRFNLIINANGLLIEDVKFAVGCAAKFGNLTLTPGDAPPKPRKIGRRDPFPTLDEQICMNLYGEAANESIADMREVTAKTRRQSRQITELELKLASETSRRETAEKNAETAHRLIEERFDEFGNPKWNPANEDEVALLSLTESIINKTAIYCSQLYRLRGSRTLLSPAHGGNSRGVSPDVLALIEGTIGHAEHCVAAAAVAIRASYGHGDSSSEALLRNATENILADQIKPAASQIASRHRVPVGQVSEPVNAPESSTADLNRPPKTSTADLNRPPLKPETEPVTRSRPGGVVVDLNA